MTFQVSLLFSNFIVFAPTFGGFVPSASKENVHFDKNEDGFDYITIIRDYNFQSGKSFKKMLNKTDPSPKSSTMRAHTSHTDNCDS